MQYEGALWAASPLTDGATAAVAPQAAQGTPQPAAQPHRTLLNLKQNRTSDLPMPTARTWAAWRQEPQRRRRATCRCLAAIRHWQRLTADQARPRLHRAIRRHNLVEAASNSQKPQH